MNTRSETPLQGRIVALSISESEDLGGMGLLSRDLNRALEEIALRLVFRGARIAYGGDLRAGGFTHTLFARMAEDFSVRLGKGGEAMPPLLHSVAAIVWHQWTPEQLFAHAESLAEAGVIELLQPDGNVLRVVGDSNGDGVYVTRSDGEEERFTDPEALQALWPQTFRTGTPIAPGPSLSAMRRTMATQCDARIVVGGKVQKYLGNAPGIGEEALETLRANKPLVPLGGFGGSARDVAWALGLLAEDKSPWHAAVGPGHAENLAALRERRAAFLENAERTRAIGLLRKAAESDVATELAELCLRTLVLQLKS